MNELVFVLLVAALTYAGCGLVSTLIGRENLTKK
jgi:hypothetical protein